jgi:hypothetical protein
MLPIRLIETEREDFEGPIVEFWRDDTFVGMVFWDGEVPIVQFYPDGEGDVHDIDVRELQLLLETALRIVDPDAFDDEMRALRAAAGDPEWGDEHPATVDLLAEFDDKAVFRSDDGEGFFTVQVAAAFISRCAELDLAVVEMEGLDFDGQAVEPRPGLELEVATQPMMTWSEFRTFANTTAQRSLAEWPDDSDLVVAFVFQQPDGETIVA